VVIDRREKMSSFTVTPSELKAKAESSNISIASSRNNGSSVGGGYGGGGGGAW
jgi:uncharacterized membrane protein